MSPDDEEPVGGSADGAALQQTLADADADPGAEGGAPLTTSAADFGGCKAAVAPVPAPAISTPAAAGKILSADVRRIH